jgi:hypothetical protein
MYGLQQPRRGCAVDAGRKLRAMRVGGRVEEAAQAGINAAALGGPVEIAEDLRAAGQSGQRIGDRREYPALAPRCG